MQKCRQYIQVIVFLQLLGGMKINMNNYLVVVLSLVGDDKSVHPCTGAYDLYVCCASHWRFLHAMPHAAMPFSALRLLLARCFLSVHVCMFCFCHFPRYVRLDSVAYGGDDRTSQVGPRQCRFRLVCGVLRDAEEGG